MTKHHPFRKRILLIGDSTIQTNDHSTFPQTGWGQCLAEYLPEDITVINFAKNGMSSKSFLNAGYYEAVREAIRPHDFLLIQFGHNDQKDDADRHTDPYTDYQDYLKHYCDQAKTRGAYPILITPLTRRRFNAQGVLEDTHGDYGEAMLALGTSRAIPVIDLYRLSKAIVNSTGVESSKALFLHLPPNTYEAYPDGLIDNTHLSPLGASVFAKAVADSLHTLLETTWNGDDFYEAK